MAAGDLAHLEAWSAGPADGPEELEPDPQATEQRPPGPPQDGRNQGSQVTHGPHLTGQSQGIRAPGRADGISCAIVLSPLV